MSDEPVFKDAVRGAGQGVSLLVALGGYSGSGKTLSALKLARGLAGGDDTKIAFIDTESGRGLHYAVAKGEAPGPDKFAFKHAEMRPPFSPDRYLRFIVAADDAGYEAIVVDSMSHVWEGEGGCHDWHNAIVADIVASKRQSHRGNYPFDEAKEAEKANVGAWRDPKEAHKRMVNRMLQCRAHLILCFRADEKLRMETVEEQGSNGRTYKRTKIVSGKDLPPEERWSFISEKRLPYEMGLSLLLSPDNPGVPIPRKLQEQHAHAVPLDQRLSERSGELLRAWARGDISAAVARAQATNPQAPPASFDEEAYAEMALQRIAAADDPVELRDWLNSDQQKQNRGWLIGETRRDIIESARKKLAELEQQPEEEPTP